MLEGHLLCACRSVPQSPKLSKPCTLNRTPGIPNPPKPETLNPKPYTLNPKPLNPYTRKPCSTPLGALAACARGPARSKGHLRMGRFGGLMGLRGSFGLMRFLRLMGSGFKVFQDFRASDALGEGRFCFLFLSRASVQWLVGCRVIAGYEYPQRRPKRLMNTQNE